MTTQTKKKLPETTVMYSVENILTKGEPKETVVVHRLPWPRDSEKLTPFKARGYTFERPVIAGQEAPAINPFECDVCGKICKSDLGLTVHKKSHKEG